MIIQTILITLFSIHSTISDDKMICTHTHKDYEGICEDCYYERVRQRKLKEKELTSKQEDSILMREDE